MQKNTLLLPLLLTIFFISQRNGKGDSCNSLYENIPTLHFVDVLHMPCCSAYNIVSYIVSANITPYFWNVYLKCFVPVSVYMCSHR